MKRALFTIPTLVVLALQAWSPSSLAAPEPATIVYHLETAKLPMVDVKQRRLLISSSCQSSGRFACLAYSAFEQASKLKPARGTPPEIGSTICKKAGGTIVIAIAPSKDEIALCKFAKDESYIDLGSLFANSRKPR